MFICQQCSKVAGPKVSVTKKVIETKLVDHIDPAPKGYVGPTTRIDNKPCIVTKGRTQIVKEINVCPECATEHVSKEV